MLHFPEVDEVHLQNAPVAEVICQVRFPTILRIVTEQPASFQEATRSRFPHLEVQHGVSVQVDPLAAGEPAVEAQPRTFHFKSIDGKSVIALAPDFFALSTTAYRSWADFLDKLRLVADAAVKEYDLQYATRIGLRYINHLTKSNTQAIVAKDIWDVLRPELTTLWTAEHWREPVQATHQFVLAESETERLSVRAGYRQEEPVCVLDFDCYAEANDLHLDDLLDRCERYHAIIYAAFRWAIRDEKLSVFGIAADAKEGAA